MFKALLSLALLALAHAGCDNQCSGHGTCTFDGLCICYDNWGLGIGHLSGDCSERICPYDFAWADAPRITYSPWLNDFTGLHHQYAECSAQGICNRQSGECDCFPGYTGSACARMMCPNDCSGHGRCKAISTLPFGAVAADYRAALGVNYSSTIDNSFGSQDPYRFPTYFDWDATKNYACVCDAGYGEYDCSKRTCEYGTDIMNHRLDMSAAQKYQTQQIEFVSPGFYTTGAADRVGGLPSTGTFALTFKSKMNETYTTKPIQLKVLTTTFPDFLRDVRAALESLPNRVIDEVQVTGGLYSSLSAASKSTSVQGISAAALTNGYTTIPYKLQLRISFTGNNVQGPQHLLTVKAHECGDGCTPKLTGLTLSSTENSVVEDTQSDFQSYECGRRGKCDYSTGICTCFSGYTGQACNTMTALV